MINFVASCLRGRRPVEVSATILLLGIVLGTQVTGSVPGAWRRMGVPSVAPSFVDARIITSAAACVQNGRDPYTDYTCDPYGRAFNYPPIWLELSRFSIGPGATKWVGVLIAASTFAALAAIFSSGSPLSGALIVLSILSPPILFGIERGNIDLLIFVLLTFGILGTSALRPRSRTALRALLIVVLAVLKIYPLAAAGMFMRSGRGWFLSMLVAVVGAGTFVWAAYGRLGVILANTPTNYWYSFGAAPLFLLLRETLGASGPAVANAKHVQPGDIPGSSFIRWIASAAALGCALILVLGRVYFSRSRRHG